MRILHTSDWHLGRSFGPVSLHAEQAAFLDWLVGVVISERVDLVVVAGDGSKGQDSVTSLSAYVSAHALSGVYQHGKLPPGNAPNSLVCKKAVGYVPALSEASIVPAVVMAADGALNNKVLWVVTKAEDKVAPVGMALVTTKQMIVQGNAVVAL